MSLSLISELTTPVDEIFTVSDVTAEVGRAIQRTARSLWVRAEISEYKAYTSGHHYFTLRDARSQMRCVMWKNDARRLTLRPEAGMEVFVLGRASYWEEKGEFRFTASALLPTADLGAAHRELERVRALLKADGLLAPERKRPLPRYAETIAVVTSTDGAALRDIITVTRRRWPCARLLVVGARVPGDGAPAALARALKLVNRLPGIDLCIIGRGGGARDDLAGFNSEQVCRALADVRVPTISAVGHETDVSLSDLVADHRAATPSAAAEAAVPDCREVLRGLRDLAVRLSHGLRRRTGLAEERLARCGDRSRMALEQLLERRQHQLERLAAQLDALSPLRVLERGYAVAQDGEGRVLRAVGDFPAGLAFRLRLANGQVEARVEQGDS
jgi:exodeoxyribonuclease VII large subunit